MFGGSYRHMDATNCSLFLCTTRARWDLMGILQTLGLEVHLHVKGAHVGTYMDTTIVPSSSV
jgi:hypothetical protein